ncbi:Valine--tRNA ligase [Phycisphaerae bacterium RAS2]|nr:Valine--tRNA ligase [Phycisphaerae bacterium RAS2]
MAKSDSKAYDSAAVEARIFQRWLDAGHFHPAPDARPRDQRFSMVIPPPNVTGALHLGHALNNTLQDILIRRHRMAGHNTFWLVGTDHAGIATQATVEKTIRKDEGKSRHDLGREEMVRRIWEWKQKYGSRIVEQLKLMGCSCDYQRERFTLDEGCAAAVRETFFKLFRDGLIYRGKRLVNWDTQLQTAVADDEVYHETVKGHFYHFKYPIIGSKPGEPTHVHIATTRPETMLGDTAVAVHPEPDAALEVAETQMQVKLREASAKERPEIEAKLADIAERKRTLLPTLLKLRDMAKGSASVPPAKILLPLVNREIPLICDDWADPTLGSGCVKITPAHDANDYAVWERSQQHADASRRLAIINIMTADGKVNEHGGKYAGQKFADARKQVVEDLQNWTDPKTGQSHNLVEKIEDRQIDLAHSDRSNTEIQPYLSDQWFVKMGDLDTEHAKRIDDLHGATGLAQMAIDAICKNDAHYDDPAARANCDKVHIFPRRYEKTYTDWLSAKRDWCISRQLWWGHRIPVWAYRPFGDRNTRPSIDGAVGQGQKIIELHEKLATWAKEGRAFLKFAEDAEANFPEIGMRRACAEQYIGVSNPADAEIVAFLEGVGFEQDPDVLDTWFSSALWPHSTMGWPGATQSDDTQRAAGFSLRGADASSERDAGTANEKGDGTASERGALDRTAARAEARGSLDKERGSFADARGSLALLNYFYPTSVLSTAREIITLWVARMVITGLYNTGKVPFRDVVIHPVIQDGQGRKMSKSLGNGVDPVDIIDEYGADALRFTLAELATETQDIRMPVQKKRLPDGREINISEKFEKGRNFCNKLWQAATGYVLRNLDGYDPRPLDPKSLRLEDRWILSRLTAAQQTVDAALTRYRFADAVGTLYRFMWDEYCSWYIEMTKSRLQASERDAPDSTAARAEARGSLGARGTFPEAGGSDQSARGVAQQILVHCLDQLLRMLHPVVPYVTEAVWQELNAVAPHRGLRDIPDAAATQPDLIAATWPAPEANLRDEAVEREMEVLHNIIRSARDIRASVNDYRGKSKQPSMRTLPAIAIRADATACKLIETYRAFILPLAGCDALTAAPDAPKPRGAMGRVMGALQVYAPVADLIDLAEVRKTDEARLAELKKSIARDEGKLASADFVSNAKPEVVEQARQRVAELRAQITALEEHLKELGN